MVETHNVEFADDDIDGQKIVFFDGKYHEIEDVHIGNYDFRFNFNDKKYFSINSENVVTIRIHTEPRINEVCHFFIYVLNKPYKPSSGAVEAAL